MKTRTVYAVLISLFALLTAFYAVMTLAFYFGEDRPEWFFPLLITVIAILSIWTAVKLWRRAKALWPTGITLFVVAALMSWIIIPGGDWDAAYIMLVLAFLVSLGLLLALFSAKIRKALS